MANEQNDITNGALLSDIETDVIGEILNISMGAAATAVSAMLDKQVTITTPTLTQSHFGEYDLTDMDPSVMVKINYVEGISGTNVIVFRSRDMQIILNLLMGNEEEPDSNEVFEFDDMSMSAACEVMNQMMGSSATALSEVLGRVVNISTPTAHLSEEGKNLAPTLMEIQDDTVVSCVSFRLMVADIIDSNFISFLTLELAREIISIVMPSEESVAEIEAETGQMQEVPTGQMQEVPTGQMQEVPVQEVPVQEVPEEQAPALEALEQEEELPIEQFSYQEEAAEEALSIQIQETPALEALEQEEELPIEQFSYQEEAAEEALSIQTQEAPASEALEPEAPALGALEEPIPVMMEPAQTYQQPAQTYQQPVQTYQQPPLSQQQMPYGMDNNTGQVGNMVTPMNQINVRRPQFPDFSGQASRALADGANFSLLMGVPLEVSIVIGKTKRKIKDILEFGQGTVLELEKQTGAPAEIIVNGQLLAYGDVIVIGDNFGVRITEIVGTKELMESLDGQA